MGSLERKLKRKMMRNEFNNFTDQWSKEKNFQIARLEHGESLGKDERLLGRKPSFSMFVDRYKQHEAIRKVELEIQRTKKQEEEKKIDLEWKDE